MKSSKKKSLPLRARLFIYLALFLLFSVALLWLLQVFFMDNFYLAVTTETLSRSSDSLSEVCRDGGDIESAVFEESAKAGFCISVYEIRGAVGTKISESHVQNGCYVHTFLTGDNLRELYSSTQREGGRLVSDVFDGHDKKKLSSILYSQIVPGPDGFDYFIIFNADSYPKSTISATITVQLLFITVIFLSGAVVLALVMSKRISRPVSRLCIEAEKLAVGNYNVAPVSGGIAELDRLSDTLTYAAGQLSRADELQRDLVANVTHDLRTPLTLISGYGEIMRDIPGEITPENMQVIIDESHRLSALVSDVLEVSKSRSGQLELKLGLFDLTAAVRNIVQRYSSLLGPMGYTVTYENDGNSAVVTGDEGKILQVLCNLLNNAANFSGKDKVITVRQYVKDGLCRTEVIDTGVGIPEDELATVWDRYYRARDRQNKGIPGTGLGLSIVKEFLLAHGAGFGVSSAPGRGSIFWFELPVEK